MLEGLDDINWAEIQHHDRSASHVPESIRKLAYDSDALRYLFADGQETGGLYESTPYIVPFVIETLAEKTVLYKSSILRELSYVFWGTPVTYRRMEEARIGVRVYDAFVSKLSVLKYLAQSGDTELRIGIIELLGRFTENASELVPELMNIFEHEHDETVQLTLLEAIYRLTVLGIFKERGDFLPWFNKVADNQELQSVRVEVALDLIDLATDRKWIRYTDEILPATIDLLVAELNNSKSKEVASRLAKLDLQAVITLLQSGRLKLLSIHLLVRESLNRVFYPRTGNNRGDYAYDFSQFGLIPIISYSELADHLSTRRFYIPDKTLGTALGPTPQRQLLTAIANLDRFWEIPTNLFSFFYGLPDTREELRAFLLKANG